MKAITTLMLVLLCWLNADMAVYQSSYSTEPVVEDEEPVTITLTIYNPVEDQCDEDPLVTANNWTIDTVALKAGDVRWMALSRDLLSRWGGQFNYGDTILVQAGDMDIDGPWVIADTMNKRYTERGDLLFHQKVRTLGKWKNVRISRINES